MLAGTWKANRANTALLIITPSPKFVGTGRREVADLSLNVADEIVERIAERAADLVAERKVETVADGYLDLAGAADFLACPRSRIYSLVSAKRIPHHRDGSRLLFDRQELREYVHNGGARRP